MRLNKDLWRIILLIRKEKQLDNRSSDRNIYVLYYFAKALNLPVSFDMSMRWLSIVISTQLSWGGPRSEESRKYFEKMRNIEKLGKLANSMGINVNQRLNKIMEDIGSRIF